MTVDVRARSFCNLGTIIQANLADEAISARQGLIRCRGQVVLKGISTPTVGSFVYFGWEKDGVISRIPRTLRVLSSFANPFTRQTTVQLGDKLVYLANLRGKKADPQEAEPRPDTPNRPEPPEPGEEPDFGPDPVNFPPSGFEYDPNFFCYLPKDQGANLFGSEKAASQITPIEPVLFAPASILGKVPLTIPAQSVLGKCLEALGISSTGESLIAQFTRESFDLSSGYVNVIDQLLANESLVGYLDEDEVLNIQKFSQSPSAGPLFTSNEIIDLTGINQGILPGQTVTVTYESRRLTGDPPREPDPAPEPPPEPDPEAPPEPEPEPGSEEDLLNTFAPEFNFSERGSTDEADAQRNWEEELTQNTTTVEFFLEDGFQINFSNLETSKTQTIYDEDDYVKTRITTQTGIGAAYLGGIIQAQLQDAYDNRSLLISNFEIPRQVAALANSPVLIVTREDFTYKEVKEDVVIGGETKDLICKDGELAFAEPTVADEDPGSRKEKILVAQKRVTATSTVVIAGQVNLTQFDFTQGLTIPGGQVLTEVIDTTYEQNQPSGQTKTVVRRYKVRSRSVAGQQDISAKAFATTDQNALNKLISSASSLELEGVDVVITRDRSFGVQKRPPEADRLLEEQTKEPPAGSNTDEVTSTTTAEIDQTSPAAEAQPSLPVEMPFGSDDGWVWTASDGFEFKGSNAQALALRYARAQNDILRGNRSGVSLQLPAYVMPVAPLSFVYLDAGSVTGAYRANGMSWAINSDGILCAMDALFSGGVGGSGTPFFPVAPGITTLPAAPTPTAATPAPANALAAPEGFDPEAPGSIWSQLPVGTEPTYAQSIAPTALVPVVNERVSLVGATRSVLEVQERNYALVLPTVAVEYINKSVIQPFVRLAGDPLSVAVSAQAAALKYTKRIKGGVGTFTTAGFGAGSIRDYRIGTNAGTFALSGNAALLKYQQLPLLAEATAFALAGQEARFFKGASLKANTGVFASSGGDAGKISSSKLQAARADFVLIGQEAGSKRAYRFTVSEGSFSVAGQDTQIGLVPTQLGAVLTYTGNGATQSITGSGFKPGLIITRSTNSTGSNYVLDQRRGPTTYWSWNTALTQGSSTSGFTSFDNDGFSLGSLALFNTSARNYIALLIREAGASSSNTSGTITSTTNVSDDNGYSYFTYTGNGVVGATVGHGLSSTPELLWVRNYQNTGVALAIGSPLIGINTRLDGNTTDAATADTNSYRGFGSSVLTLGVYGGLNAASRSYAGYAFKSTDSIKIGTFSGNGVDPVSIDAGFRPSFVYYKVYSGATGNHIFYYRVNEGDGLADFFSGNVTSVVGTSSVFSITSTGFAVGAGGGGNTTNGSAVIYMAVR